MPGLPPTLEELLSIRPPSDDAWSAFTREYTALLLHVARSTARDRDDSMDAYAFLLDKLREDECRRLRAYTADPISKFTTWLVVVARRLCVDHHRAKYGRVRGEASNEERERLGLRRKIADLDATLESADAIPDEHSPSAADAMEKSELSHELRALVLSLAPEDRLLLALRFDDELSAAEIAPIVKAPSQFHVYRRINALLLELRTNLKRRGFGSAAS